MRSSPPPVSAACLRVRSSSIGWRRIRVWISRLRAMERQVAPSYRNCRRPAIGASRRSSDDVQCGVSRLFLHAPEERLMTPRRSRSAHRERRLSHLNWMEMGELVPRRVHTLLLPVGTLEAHGITSLGTDNVIPTRLSEALAERLNAMVAPTIPFGVTAHLGALAGGTHVRPE